MTSRIDKKCSKSIITRSASTNSSDFCMSDGITLRDIRDLIECSKKEILKSVEG